MDHASANTDGRDDATIFLTVPEAARHLRCSQSEIYALIKRGELPAMRLGGMLRIPRSVLEKLAAEAVCGLRAKEKRKQDRTIATT
jgi:excisionase family DNA binding protein